MIKMLEVLSGAHSHTLIGLRCLTHTVLGLKQRKTRRNKHLNVCICILHIHSSVSILQQIHTNLLHKQSPLKNEPQKQINSSFELESLAVTTKRFWKNSQWQSIKLKSWLIFAAPVHNQPPNHSINEAIQHSTQFHAGCGDKQKCDSLTESLPLKEKLPYVAVLNVKNIFNKT